MRKQLSEEINQDAALMRLQDPTLSRFHAWNRSVRKYFADPNRRVDSIHGKTESELFQDDKQTDRKAIIMFIKRTLAAEYISHVERYGFSNLKTLKSELKSLRGVSPRTVERDLQSIRDKFSKLMAKIH